MCRVILSLNARRGMAAFGLLVCLGAQAASVVPAKLAKGHEKASEPVVSTMASQPPSLALLGLGLIGIGLHGLNRAWRRR